MPLYSYRVSTIDQDLRLQERFEDQVDRECRSMALRML